MLSFGCPIIVNVCPFISFREMSKNALKNMKKREKQKEKKAAEAATSGS